MDERQRTRHGRSFGVVADAYDHARPSYPADAVVWMVGERRARVLDLAAGTGALTRPLLRAGHVVLAIDPLAAMLVHLRRRSAGPTLAVVAGSAEQVPVSDAQFDAVTVGQAYHWFDEDRTVPELARVLRPGGVLALAWNVRDERVPWVRRLGAALGSTAGLPEPSGKLGLSGLFGPVEWRRFRTHQWVDRAQLLDLARSRSYVAVLPPDERGAVLDRVGDLYDRVRGDNLGLRIPYVTHCLRATRLDTGPGRV